MLICLFWFHALILAHLSIFRLHVACDLKALINLLYHAINASKAGKGRTGKVHVVYTY